MRELVESYERKLQQASEAASDKAEGLRKSHEKEVRGLNARIKELEEKLAHAGSNADDDFDRYAF